jgi:peroxiredoxin
MRFLTPLIAITAMGLVAVTVTRATRAQRRAAAAEASWQASRLNDERLRQLIGHPIPETMLRDVRGDTVRLAARAGRQPTVIWLVSGSSCLACLAEVQEWKSFAQTHPDAAVALVLERVSPDDARALQLSEHLPFFVLPDPNGDFRKMLGAEIEPPMRLLALNGAVVLATRGSVPSATEFLAQSTLVLPARGGASLADSR